MPGLGLAGVLALGAPSLFPWTPRLVWNASASAPEGLYLVLAGGRPQVGDLVAVQPPRDLAAWLARREALPDGVLLIKRVAALTPSLVCRAGDQVTLDGRPAARARAVDRQGRGLPVWRGCRRLAGDEVFLLNPTPNSLDGRYFGPLPGAAVVGRVRSIWLIEGAADGV